MYVLHHFPMSQHARRVVALLEAAGLPYELRHVALDRGEHMSPAHLAINPNHQVPTLVDGDLVIHESNAILRYLCARHDLGTWNPADPRRRAIVDQWLDWNQSRLAPAVIDIVMNKVFLAPQGDAAVVARGEARLAELVPILESGLAQTSFLAGETPTIADLSVGSNLDQLDLAGAAPSSPQIVAWRSRLRQLPGVQASLRALTPA